MHTKTNEDMRLLVTKIQICLDVDANDPDFRVAVEKLTKLGVEAFSTMIPFGCTTTEIAMIDKVKCFLRANSLHP